MSSSVFTVEAKAFGPLLYQLITHEDISLIEPIQDRKGRLFRVATNKGDFFAYFKYSNAIKELNGRNQYSFTLYESDKDILWSNYGQEIRFYLILVCGTKIIILSDEEVAEVLDKDDVASQQGLIVEFPDKAKKARIISREIEGKKLIPFTRFPSFLLER